MTFLTEEQAKTKWCPRVSRDGRNGDRVPPGLRCIASECMAWREHVAPEHREYVYDRRERPDGEGWEPYTDSPSNCAWARPVAEKRGGYCGLAGEPTL